MQYIITFLEGFISFISPCMLPMLPVYISYFAGGDMKNNKPFTRAIFFILGFTLVFSALGLFAGSIGALFTKYRTIVNIISGSVVIVLGLSFMDIIKIPFFRGVNKSVNITGIFSAFLFGMVFSVSLTPCVGVFLGSALMLASNSETAVKGMVLLVVYSLGLGIPFLISAVLIDKLKNVFSWIKNNYKSINLVSGIFLIIVGVSMVFGLLDGLLNIFS